MLGRSENLPQRFAQLLPRDRLEPGQPVDGVAQKFHPDACVLVRHQNFDRIPPDPKLAPLGRRIVPLILDFHQTGQELLPGDGLPRFQSQNHSLVILGRAQAVNTGDAGDHDHILTGQQTSRGRQSEAFDLLVNGGIFFDVGVSPGDVGLGLVVVEVTHEVLHGVIRKKGLQLAVQLGRQRLVVTHHQSGNPEFLDDVGHREGLARAGHAKQDIMLLPTTDPLQQSGNRRRLVPRRTIGGFDLKIHGVFGSCRIRTYNLLVKSQQLYH